ncbi:MAG: hypothetical protein ACRC41_00700 [Sarcina sp.]
MIIYLVIISAILIILNIKAINKKNNRKNNFDEVLSCNKEKISDFTLEMIKLRKELSETVVELQQDIFSLKEEISVINKRICASESLAKSSLHNKEDIKLERNIINDINIKNDEPYMELSEEEKIGNDNTKSSLNKVMQVKKLISEGLSDDIICSKMGIGKGELLLIKGLYN